MKKALIIAVILFFLVFALAAEETSTRSAPELILPHSISTYSTFRPIGPNILNNHEIELLRSARLWSNISMGIMAFRYRDLIVSLNETKSTNMYPTAPYWQSVIAASFGMGALTAIGFAFDDYVADAALVLASICLSVSSISGVMAIISTHTYSQAVNY